MRTSNYIHYVTIPETKEHFLVHSYTGAIDKVSANVVRFLLERRDSRPSTHVKDEKIALESVADEPVASDEPLDSAVVEMLRSRGYLTTKSVEEEREYVRSLTRWLHMKSVTGAFPGFHLIPTYECNLRCPYCFETETRIDLNKQGCLGAVMSVEMADAAFATMDVLYDRRRPPNKTLEEVRKNREIVLYGGEPLQAMTRDIIQYIVRKGRSRDMYFSAITNAVDLHLFEDVLGPNGIRRIQVTLDGPKEIHDLNRIGPKHRHTYDGIMENLKIAVGTGTNVTIRLHTDWKSVDRTSEILDELTRRELLGKKNFSIYTTPRHKWHVGQQFPIFPDMAPSQLYEKIQSMPPKVAQPLSVPDTNLVERKLNKYVAGGLGGLSTTIEYCSANTGGMHLLDLYGDIYACWDMVGKLEDRIGTYSAEGPSYSSRAGDWSARCPADIPQCSDCKYVMFHFGGCAGLPVSMGYGLLHPACYAFQDSFIALGRRFFQEGRHEKALAAAKTAKDASVPLAERPLIGEQFETAGS